MYKLPRTFSMAVLVVATTLLFAACLLPPFNSWRYGVPPTLLLADQDKSRSALQRLSGLTLPSKAKVLVASGNGTEKTAHWVIYAPGSIDNVPFDRGLNRFVAPRLEKHVRTIENAIAPYKVRNPMVATYHRWQHGDVDNQAGVVTAETGQYMVLQTFRDD
jgi:hypothetical protein